MNQRLFFKQIQHGADTGQYQNLREKQQAVDNPLLRRKSVKREQVGIGAFTNAQSCKRNGQALQHQDQRPYPDGFQKSEGEVRGFKNEIDPEKKKKLPKKAKQKKDTDGL